MVEGRGGARRGLPRADCQQFTKPQRKAAAEGGIVPMVLEKLIPKQEGGGPGFVQNRDTEVVCCDSAAPCDPVWLPVDTKRLPLCPFVAVSRKRRPWSQSRSHNNSECDGELPKKSAVQSQALFKMKQSQLLA